MGEDNPPEVIGLLPSTKNSDVVEVKYIGKGGIVCYGSSKTKVSNGSMFLLERVCLIKQKGLRVVSNMDRDINPPKIYLLNWNSLTSKLSCVGRLDSLCV